MRRFWLSLLLAMSLLWGGVANAWAASDCPYLKSADAGEHSCCPDDVMPQQDSSRHGGKPMDCKIGQACRTTPAVTPLLVSEVVLFAAPAAVRVTTDDRSATVGPVFTLWRPPRAQRA